MWLRWEPVSRGWEACDTPAIVLYSLIYALARLLIDVLIYRDRSDGETQVGGVQTTATAETAGGEEGAW